MKVDLFDFDLPQERIALEPTRPRDSARMLVVASNGTLTDRVVTDLTDILQPGDLMVVNDTRVIPAELHGTRMRGEIHARVSFNLHRRLGPERWAAFARPAKRLRPGDRLDLGAETGSDMCLLTRLDATVESVGDAGEVTLLFDLTGAALDEAIKAHGAMPLPPYIGSKRAPTLSDLSDYQTVYARTDGAVAAPTAGLHFTNELLARLADRGVRQTRVTLHVGAGTFLPVKADDTSDHRMHAEWGEVTSETVDAITQTRELGGRVVAVGTTSLRLLESAATKDGLVAPFAGETDIFITPGYRFRAVDVLMTNFHLPRSTLFMLVSAFSGLETMQSAYAHAIAEDYRFYSYGDASLLFRANPNG